MRGELKESRLAYKSEWLEVYEDLLSIDARPDKRGKKDNHYHQKKTNKVKLFNKIRLKSDSATILFTLCLLRHGLLYAMFYNSTLGTMHGNVHIYYSSKPSDRSYNEGET